MSGSINRTASDRATSGPRQCEHTAAVLNLLSLDGQVETERFAVAALNFGIQLRDKRCRGLTRRAGLAHLDLHTCHLTTRRHRSPARNGTARAVAVAGIGQHIKVLENGSASDNPAIAERDHCSGGKPKVYRAQGRRPGQTLATGAPAGEQPSCQMRLIASGAAGYRIIPARSVRVLERRTLAEVRHRMLDARVPHLTRDARPVGSVQDARKGSVENQPDGSVWVHRGEERGHRTTLGYAVDHSPFAARGVHDRPHVVDAFLEQRPRQWLDGGRRVSSQR